MHFAECRIVLVSVKWWKLACRWTRPIRPGPCKKIEVRLFTLLMLCLIYVLAKQNFIHLIVCSYCYGSYIHVQNFLFCWRSGPCLIYGSLGSHDSLPDSILIGSAVSTQLTVVTSTQTTRQDMHIGIGRINAVYATRPYDNLQRGPWFRQRWGLHWA